MENTIGILSPTAYSKRLFYICSGEGLLNHSSEPDQEALILEELRKLLRTFNADPNYKHKGSYPLCEASRKGYERVVKELISQGADVNVCDKWLCSPLYLAASHGYKNICEMLINKNADMNAKNQYGFTPLWTSIENNNIEIAKLLCKHGADVNVMRPNSHGIEMKMLTYVLLAKGDTSLAECILTSNFVPYEIESSLCYMILDFGDESRRFVQKLICAGFQFEYHHWVSSMKHKIANRPNEVTEGEQSFIQFIQIETRTPKRLQNMARVVIRTTLLNANANVPVRTSVTQLHLPPKLERFICLSDVVNID
ncbi:unnamed protein product [Mytilus coruscus]|uniref:SOCS box domain-containing protein n=1 Tax=Mytilus coruscus TaxID=42192 RepID=A0A6J8E2L7_MYTCO|nr:unnamed protein product [Mytilus coruscus]